VCITHISEINKVYPQIYFILFKLILMHCFIHTVNWGRN